MRSDLLECGRGLILLFLFSASVLVGGEKHEAFSGLLQKYVHNGLVDYDGFSKDPAFESYLSILASTDPTTLGKDAQLALWINAYNAYTIKLIADRMPISSIRDIGLGLPVISGPWSISFANVGGKEYSLNEIEHDIIREQFGDPRIHFALVCASRSCPRLRAEAYEAHLLDGQLEEDARRFINDPGLNQFDSASRVIRLSKIFDWYQSDFEEKAGSVRLFIRPYIDSDQARELLWKENVSVMFLEYDWSLNSR
jgi:hypothetical protein